MPTWDSRASDELWTRYGGKACWLGDMDKASKSMRKVPDRELWDMRQESRREMVEHIRLRYARQIAASGGTIEEIDKAKTF